MRRVVSLAVLMSAAILMPAATSAQTTTYHLHKEDSAFSSVYRQLKTAGPDANSFDFQSLSLKNVASNQALLN